MQTKNIPYTFKRNGYYYFSRRVPIDLQDHYIYPRIVRGLNTKDYSTAKVLARVSSVELEKFWIKLRLSNPNLIGSNLLKLQSNKSEQNPYISLDKALSTYLTIKGTDKNKTFIAAAERSCRYLVEATSLKDLHEYTRKDALKFRDYLIQKELAGSSIARIFNSLNSIINFSISEYALDFRNPFSGVYFDRGSKVKKRVPFQNDFIRDIQIECFKIDDDLRWLVALISDTGLRLSEAAGLSLDDIVLDHAVPHVMITPYEWRSLKTVSSERKIPLVGAALWAAKRLVSESTNSKHAFPRYNQSHLTNSNSASASLNKWLKSFSGQVGSLHSFRHSMRDRLRNVGCPVEIIDQLGGWKVKTVGQQYGEGYSLHSQLVWIAKTSLVNFSNEDSL